MKNRLIIFLVIIFIGITGVFIYSKFEAYLEKKKIENAKVVINYTDDMTTNFLSDINVSNFIESINGTILEDYKIDTTKVGPKRINFSYINDEGIKLDRSFEINIADVTPPMIWLSDSYSVNVGFSKKLEDRIMCIDDYDSKPKCEIIGEYDLNTTGFYKLNFIASDSSGNTSNKEFTLHVKEKKEESQASTTNNINYLDAYDMYKNDNNKIGIDVSFYQGDINFEALKKVPVEFAMLRVGSKKNGEYFQDTKFIQNIEGFTNIGIPVGIYFYSYARNEQEAKEDALWIIDQIAGYKIDLPIVYDFEDWNNFNQYEMSIYNLNKNADVFIETVKKNGYDGLLYGSKSYLEKIWNTKDKKVWLAHYNKETDYSDNFMMWQFSSNGRVDGINSAVDLDILYTE